MKDGLLITNLDGWTLVSIWYTLETRRGAVGAFVFLLQEDMEIPSTYCLQCASSKGVRRLCVMTLPLSLTVGHVEGDVAWLLLCTTCSIALIDDWRNGRRARALRRPFN